MNVFKETQYKSPFALGLEAARQGISWVNCPYIGSRQDYERSEWLRGHQSWFQ